MLISAVVSPEAFRRRQFEHNKGKLYVREAKELLKDIQSNGVLLFDEQGKLKNDLVDTIKTLPDRYAQELKILIESILQPNEPKKRKRFFQLNLNLCASNASCTDLDLACDLAEAYDADGLVVTQQERCEVTPLKDGIEVIPLNDYSESKFYEKRRRLMEGIPPVDKLGKEEFEDCIKRSVRFAPYLSFYDGQLGKCGDDKNCSRFKDGISYILSLWMEHGILSNKKDSFVEIITCPHPTMEEESCINKVKKNIWVPLSKEFPWPITIKMKKDPEKKMHDRYLDAGIIILSFGRGFDIFKRDGNFHSFEISVKNNSDSHLRECRELENLAVISESGKILI